MSEASQKRRLAALKAWETRRQRQELDETLVEKLHQTADDMQIRGSSFDLYAQLIEQGKLSRKQIEAVKRFIVAFQRLDERMAHFYWENQELMDQATNDFFSR